MNDPQTKSPLIEVKIEKTFDFIEKSWDDIVFTKLYHSVRTSGLLAQLSDKNFRTLICLATFMDANGHCYPSQKALAKALGISRAGVSKRLKSLLAFRWQGKPLVTTVKVRGNGGLFRNTVYTILAPGLRIFDEKKDEKAHVTPSHVAGAPANNNQFNNNNVTEKYKSIRSDPLPLQLARDMSDYGSLAYYRKMVKKHPTAILLRARGEVLEEKNIKHSRGAMFNYLVKKYARFV